MSKTVKRLLSLTLMFMFLAVPLSGCAETESTRTDVPAFASVLKLGYYKRYAEVGKSVNLPWIYAVDGNGNTVNASSALTFNGNTVAFADGAFTPQSTGTYKYNVSIPDGKGGEIVKEAVIEAVESGSYKLNIIAELGEEYGVMHQTSNFCGLTPSFCTDKKYGYDSGSLKVSVNMDYYTDQQFSLKNVFIEDITPYNAIYFYVYNDSDHNLILRLNYGESDYQYLLPRRWNKVTFADLEKLTARSTIPLLQENFSLKNINGLTIANHLIDWTGVGGVDLYFSSIYAQKPVSIEQLLSRMAALPDVLTQSDEAEYEELLELFNNLPSQTQLDNAAAYRDMQAKYSRYLKDKYLLEEEAGKTVYFDREYGLKQIRLRGCDAVIDSAVKYGDEAASLKVTSFDDWEAKIIIDYPVIYDCTDYNELYVYVYYQSEGNPDFRASFFPWGVTFVPLVKGSWTKVSLSNWSEMPYLPYPYLAARDNITSIQLTIMCGPSWDTRLPQGQVFYVSPVYVG